MFVKISLVMSVITIKGRKLDFSEIHDHLLNCKECRKARKDFHDVFDWHKKELNEENQCPKCGNPEHIDKCNLCRIYLEKFRLTLSAHMIELIVTKMKLF